MRFLRLDLIRIGPFAGRTLTFDQGEFGLHLIYGPNEGGKSSSLRALSQWLFGIKGEKSCRDHFVHSHNELRVGGVIENESGQTLQCIRRKGGQKSLRAGDDKTAVDLSDLHAMLHGIDEKQFGTQFGIDLDQLVDGGMSIVQSGGDLGQSLFAAGSGTAGVNQLVKSLDSQCEQLLKSRGNLAAVNAAIIDLNKARKTLSEASIPSKQWQAIRDSLQDSIDKRKMLDDQLVELESQRDRLERIHQSLATISSLKDARAALADHTDVPALRTDFSSQRAETVAALTAAKAAFQSAQSERRSLAERIDGLLVPQTILDQEAAIAHLYKNLERYREWLRTCPKLESERQLLKTQIDRVLNQLGRQTDDVRSGNRNSDDHGNIRIGIADRQRIVELAEQRSGLIQSSLESKADAEEKARQLEAETQDLAALPPCVDTNELRRAVDEAQKLGDCDQQLADDQQRLDGLIERGEVLLKQLPLWNGPLDELESLPLPTSESVTRFASDWSAADQLTESLAGEVHTLEDSIADAEAKLNALQLSQDVPTEEELTEVRSQRDRAWLGIAAKLSRPDETDDANDAADQFETLLRRADDIGDRLRREAERVAQKSRLISDRDAWTQALETRRARFDAAHLNRQNLVGEWKGQWTLANIDPRSPLEMREWLAAHGQLVELADSIRQQTLKRDQSERRIQLHRTNLLQRFSETFSVDSDDEGSAPGDPNDMTGQANQPLRQLIDRCLARCKSLDSVSTKHDQLTARIDQIRSQQSASQARWDDANSKQSRWQQEWSVAVDALDGNADLTASQALAMLQAIDQVAADIDKSAELANAWSNQRLLIEEFEASVDQLMQRLGVRPSEAPVDQTVADWQIQLRHAREQKATRDGLIVQRDRVEQQLTDAQQSQAKLADLLEQLRREAGCESVDDLPDVERRSAERGRIEQEIESLEKQLRQSAQGTEIDAFIAAAGAEDADRLVPRMTQLDEEIQRIKVERVQLSESIGVQREDLNRMDGSDNAAKASEDAEIALVQVRQHAETYTRLKLASVVLKRAIQRYREQNQGPLIDRASELFAKLTLGAFEGLRSDFGDDGQPIIVGVRGTADPKSDADGISPAAPVGPSVVGPSLVPVNGMSEGTCDQMFLALRIASLEQYFEHHPPVPFVVDDILVKFDDARSAAAMEVLAELSLKTQVIVFTHHQHLIDVARSAVAPQQLFIQSLEDAAQYRPPSQAPSGTSTKVAAKASPKKKAKPAKKKPSTPPSAATLSDSQEDRSADNFGELF